MKVYKAEYGKLSSGRACSIIFASSKRKAVKLIEEHNGDPAYSFFVRVYRKPVPWTHNPFGRSNTEYRLTEIPMEEGIVYTGRYCC